MDTVPEFLAKYPVRAPDLTSKNNEDELKLLTVEDGVKLIEAPPAIWALGSLPPETRDEYDKHEFRYLWIFDDRGIPCIKEISESTLLLESKKAKHTNLSGGEKASVGGEVYFSNHDEVYLSGSSGRYRFENLNQLMDAANIFKVWGYATCCLGWDTDRERPSTVFREGVAQWV